MRSLCHSPRGPLIVVLVVLAATLLGVPPAQSAAGSWQSQEVVPGEFVEARLIAAVEGVGNLTALPIGLQLRLDGDWKTYWRSPGDAGLPPRADWSGSSNVRDIQWHWPAPARFSLFGLDTFGYAKEVVFPLSVTPLRPGEPVSLEGMLDILVCSDICVPATFQVRLDLPSGPAGVSDRSANLIERYTSRVPGDGALAGLDLESAVLDGGALLVTASARDGFDRPDILVEAPRPYVLGRAELDIQEGGRRVQARLPIIQDSESGSLLGSQVTLTLVDGNSSAEWRVNLTRGSVQPAEVVDATSTDTAIRFPIILGLAVLGGLILNLMPCVLPVLSLKLLSIVGHGGEAPAQVRAGFLASAAGILASFMLLAAGTILVQSAGGAVGWGVQFQEPLFLVFMVVLLTLFACNLFGLFEIILPPRLNDLAGRFGSGGGLGGHFATGALATLLATPCSAPFLGTAVGFALSSGPIDILAVFLALGVGLALPYLLVAAAPQLASRLPRPGPWMVTVKRALGMALVGTALWLLAVLSAQLSLPAAITVGLLMLVLGMVFWLRHGATGRARTIGTGLAAAIALGAFLAPATLDGKSAEDAAASGMEADWQVFNERSIASHVADGRTVFVDVTADWCLTCQANKLLVLDRENVKAALGESPVVAMRADWTRPDPDIAAFLASFGRYGIPFNVVYGPEAPDGIALPELLTVDVVLDALERAQG